MSGPAATDAWNPALLRLERKSFGSCCQSRSSDRSSSTTALAMTAMRRKTQQQQQQQQQQRQAKQTRQAQPNQSPKQQQQQEEPSSSSSSSSSQSILDDGHGRVNADLATTLWQWEQQHTPKLSISTRQGLRLVNDIVTSIAESPRGQKLTNGNDDTVRTDLVQEGVMALMDALNEYQQWPENSSREDDNESDSDKQEEATSLADRNKRFYAYARPYIENRLWCTLDETSRPCLLPEIESTVWKRVQEIRPQLQSELGGRPPTTKELAARLEMNPQTLEQVFAARRGALSIESTLEIKNPDSLEDQAAHFTDQEEYDKRHWLDTGDKIIQDESLEEYQDDQKYEGEDEMWIQSHQIAAPLRDLIPDGGPSPDDLALSDMIRHDVSEFLTKSLTQEEVQVVRMSFGLDAGEPLQWKDIAKTMGIEIAQVKDLLRGALGKLRTTYRMNYVETYLEDDEFDGEDSV